MSKNKIILFSGESHKGLMSKLRIILSFSGLSPKVYLTSKTGSLYLVYTIIVW